MQLRIEDNSVLSTLKDVCELAKKNGGKAHVVGGAVRDSMLGLPVKEIDIEVFGVEPARLRSVLGEHYRLDLVGEAFGVIRLHGRPVDISIPRKESKAGLGHRGFEILSDPTLSFEAAAARRDFTINSMAWDPSEDRILDPFKGSADLRARILRHTSERFVDDPLRVLRGMQFAARFDLEVAPETVELCRNMDMEDLARERIFEEWKKLILLGRTPSRGLAFLKDCGWIRFYPELEALVGCSQEPEWHPEGDVWMHTLHCMDAFAGEPVRDAREDLTVGLAVLCHDFGKPATTAFERERLRSIQHEAAGEAPTRKFLSGMTDSSDLINEVVALVLHHLKPLQLYEARAGDAAIRRLAVKVKRIDRLVRVARADMQGRPPMPFEGFPAGEWLLGRARFLEVQDSAPRPIVKGRHLIELGLEPGPSFGPILRKCYEAQIEGRISNRKEGIDFARELLLGPGEV
jgi:tRNA nucleotidyltransferase (CCA-adding enzyme)